MFQARFCHASCVVDGQLYVIGGCDPVGSPTNSVLRFDPSLNQWFPVSPLLYARYGLSAVVYRGAIYAVGGYSADGQLHHEAQIFKPAKGMWEPCGIEALKELQYFNVCVWPNPDEDPIIL